jgi:hypothetical protein
MESAKKYWPQIIGGVAAAALIIYLIRKQSRTAKAPTEGSARSRDTLFKSILDQRADRNEREQ